MAPRSGTDRAPAHDERMEEATRRALAVAAAAGLDAAGVTAAVPFEDTRRILEERKAAGLHAGMGFTYRNPARSSDPTLALRNARSVVVAARRYLRRPPPPPAAGSGPRGRVARYARLDDYAPLRAGLEQVAAHLRQGGARAVVLADANALVDRAAAVRAGIGWFGRNSLVLLPGRGSWYVLGSVVTDAELAPTPPPADAPGWGCGTCNRCLPACPTGALVAPGVLDARRCLAWVVQAPGPIPVELRDAVGDRLYGCDDCQEVCPPNRTAARRLGAEDVRSADHELLARALANEPAAGTAPEDATVDVLGLLAASDAELLARYGRWYIAERDPVHLRRTALVVLGNVGDPGDPRVIAALEAALASPHPLLRAHAVWAAGRLGRHALAAPLAGDPAPQVRAEVAGLAGVVDRTRS